ncbi:Mu transposase C-terminal domain-containing protein [Undibacterium sp.]|uniref:Mu transposase C-terminal domain-containing protein n=1 Tax=Undibacterium sp. TaxID=1914977 RepID=UPI0025D9B97B|nr:Mu transposase C-terminal domain-containing protein [Undibacterium sp.]
MFYRNDIISLAGNHFRILSINSNHGNAWLINTEASTPVPEEHFIETLLHEKKKGALQVIQDKLALSDMRTTPTALKRSQIAWSCIGALVTNKDIFEPRLRSTLIKTRAKEFRCSEQTIYKYLRQYWIQGQTQTALLGKFHHCGKNSKRSEIFRGRTPKILEYKGFALSKQDIKNIENSGRKYFLKNEVTTAAAAYQRLLEDHYSFLDGNGERCINPLGEKPTIRQYYYALKNLFPLEERIRKRKGDKDFERDHRATLGSMQLDCNGIGHIYEIDATIADVFLVSNKDRSRIIGKPTLYLIYDRRSRLVVGQYVGLEAPSWPTAAQAILSIFEDKVAMCHKYGIKYDQADWPAHGLMPEQFLADRGEMLSANSSLLCSGLQVTVTNAPALRPDRKGTVECGFKLIQGSMADSVPGYEPPENVRKRRGKRYDKDACLTLNEFISITLRDIIMHNRLAMDNYQLPVEAISKGIRAIPREIWAYEAPLRSGSLSRFPENFVRFSLLPKENAVVTTDGIYFKGCFYTCAEAIRDGWFVRAGQGRYKVAVSYDRRLVDDIYIHDSSNRTNFIKATLLEKSAKNYQGLSFAEVSVFLKLESTANQNNIQVRQQEHSDFHAHIDPITKQAHAEMLKQTRKKSRSARKADTKADRDAELRTRLRDEAALPFQNKVPPSSGNATENTIPMPANQKPLTMTQQPVENVEMTIAEKLLKKRQEMLNNE